VSAFSGGSATGLLDDQDYAGATCEIMPCYGAARYRQTLNPARTHQWLVPFVASA
jgi:hypothetical protein